MLRSTAEVVFSTSVQSVDHRDVNKTVVMATAWLQQ